MNSLDKNSGAKYFYSIWINFPALTWTKKHGMHSRLVFIIEILNNYKENINIKVNEFNTKGKTLIILKLENYNK